MTTANNNNPPPKAKPELKTVNNHKTSIGLKLIIFILIIACLLFYAINTNQRLYELETLVQKNSDTISQQQTTDKQKTTEDITELQNSTTTMNEKLTTLDATLKTAIQQRWYQQNDWLLLKARYYLELAEINAHWTNDKETTGMLLQQADTLLTHIHEAGLLTVRQTIASEIDQLKQLTKVDIAGILSQLDSLQQSIQKIAFKKLVPTRPSSSNYAKPDMPLTWRDHFKTSLLQLKKLVIIQHHDQPLETLYTPAYESMIRENIRLNLQEAQWAVLQHDQAVYELALNQALQNITNAFDSAATDTQAVIKQLNTLQKMKLTSSKLDLQSLTQLNQFIDTKPPVNVPSPSAEDSPS